MHQITEHQFIKATFESLVDWWAHTDFLQYNPTFWKGKGRFDCVFIETGSWPYFAKLLFVFTYLVKASEDVVIPSGEAEVTIPMALIQPFKELTPWKKDKDLGLHCLQETPPTKAIFVPAWSFICGAYIVPEDLTKKISLAVDVVDTDMFLCICRMYPEM